MRSEDLIARLEDQPFRAFRVHLTDGTTLDVTEARLVVVGRSTAVLPSRFVMDEDGARVPVHWRTIDLLHIAQFSDIDEA